jgi:cytochrome c-type biogenesis protein CcmH/NrfG
MISKHVLFGAYLAIAFLTSTGPANATTWKIILHGKVVMEDGSAPPVIVTVERICSDSFGNAPGPLTNKKGEFIWQMEIDPLDARDCRVRASHTGYTSTSVEVSGLDTTRTALDLPPIIINASVADASAIIVADNGIPGRARKDWDAAMKALDVPDMAEAGRRLEAVVDESPKFAQAWHALGVVDGRLKKQAEAKAAFEHAIESDPKLLPAYVMLARLCIKTKDWQGAEKAADATIKADPKHHYPESYLHLAVARYELKDLSGAEESAQEAIRLDTTHQRPRAEYVLGRILEAKGDSNGAKEHLAKYLQLDPAPSDVDQVKQHIGQIGKPAATDVDPDLEPL